MAKNQLFPKINDHYNLSNSIRTIFINSNFKQLIDMHQSWFIKIVADYL